MGMLTLAMIPLHSIEFWQSSFQKPQRLRLNGVFGIRKNCHIWPVISECTGLIFIKNLRLLPAYMWWGWLVWHLFCDHWRDVTILTNYFLWWIEKTLLQVHHLQFHWESVTKNFFENPSTFAEVVIESSVWFVRYIIVVSLHRHWLSN